LLQHQQWQEVLFEKLKRRFEMKPKNALISVWDKRGIVEFCKGLSELGVNIVSTGGTASLLKSSGINVKEVSELTGYPEILNKRVKTLHTFIYAGILARRDVPEDMNTLKKMGIEPIDIVVVNFYPFREMSKKVKSLGELIEYIDIGGPTMVRASAKNYRDVLVIVDPDDYQWVLEGLKKEKITEKDRFKLALKAFSVTAEYDAFIFSHLSKIKKVESDKKFFVLKKVEDLRYGENPHQKAAFYISDSEKIYEQIHGKELSYNNIIDMYSAALLVSEFEKPTAVIIKHTNPCGVASAKTLSEAYKNARQTDPVSAFGGIVGLNRKVDEETAKLLSETFLEVIIAPEFDRKALSILTAKKNLRLVRVNFKELKNYKEELRSVPGGFLIQDTDRVDYDKKSLKVVTKIKPTKAQMESLLFAWKVCKYVKSNAIVIAKGTQLIGVGAGQMSRVDSAKIAVMKALLPLEGSVAASDAFFPFRDGVDVLADAGVKAIIQPGGSVRDEEVIKAADERKIAMVFTGIRHFKH
jgi:phosphoribosylaminoimidazolecarboxamide formyltransferase/IMP cyclohydrolase